MALNRLLFVCLTVLIAVATAEEVAEECDLMKCNGPITVYKSLNCTAVYKKEGDCCPIRYDCDHLQTKSKDKCYANGNEYKNGESLKEEDSNPCDLACVCREAFDSDILKFTCAAVDCAYYALEAGCYRDPNSEECCGGPPTCTGLKSDLPQCVVGNQTYNLGDHMSLPSNPGENCYCDLRDNEAKVICKKPKRPYCDPEFYNPVQIHQNCALIFYEGQSKQTDCAFQYKCPETDDEVVKLEKSKSDDSDDVTCRYGNTTLSIGDKIKAGQSSWNQNIECVCEMPPVLTCKLTDDYVRSLRDPSIQL